MAAPPAKKQKHAFFSSLQPEQLVVLEQYESIVNNIRDHDPEAADRLSSLQSLISDFRHMAEQQSSIQSYVAATSFDSVRDACDAVDVSYRFDSPDHQWEIREPGNLSDVTLSPSVGKTHQQTFL